MRPISDQADTLDPDIPAKKESWPIGIALVDYALLLSFIAAVCVALLLENLKNQPINFSAINSQLQASP